MPTITIGANPTLRKINPNAKVTYDPKSDFPAVTVFSNPDGSYSVYAICFIPPKSALTLKPLEAFRKGKYSGYPVSKTVLLKGDVDNARVVLSFFDDIQNADLVNSPGTEFTARSFAVCYDYQVDGQCPTEPYECNVYALQFEYTVVDKESNKEVVFLAQGDLDPELSRGTVSAPSNGQG